MALAATRSTRGTELVVVITNPAAAGVDDGLARLVAARVGPHAEVCATAAPGDAQRLARTGADAGAGLVVAVGGDGTAREAAAGLVDCPQTALLTLPAGSGNSSARNLWGEGDWSSILEQAFTPGFADVRQVDLLRLVELDRVSLLGASSGFLAAVLVGARTQTSAHGIERYHRAAGAVLADMPADPTRVTVDGATLFEGPASLAAVGGGRFRAFSFQFLAESVLDDGLLDVCVLGALDREALTALVPLVPAGRHLHRPETTYARGRTVVLERLDGSPLLAEHDGEVADTAGSRLTVEVLPSALRVLAPRIPVAG